MSNESETSSASASLAITPQNTTAWLQVVQLAVTIATGTLAFMWSQQTETLKAEVAASQAVRTEDRKDQEQLLGVRLKVFEVVYKALDGDERQQRAADALVESLIHIDDPLRPGLRQVLLNQAKPELRPALAEAMAEDEQYRAWLNEAQQASPTNSSNLATMSVDVFFCADSGSALQARRKEKAEQLRLALQGQVLVRPKVRELAGSVNASPGYQVQGLQLRHEAAESMVGKALQDLVQTKTQMSFGLRQVANKTPGYLSLFVCD